MRYCAPPRCSTTASSSLSGRSAGAEPLKASETGSAGEPALTPLRVRPGTAGARSHCTSPPSVASRSGMEYGLDVHCRRHRVSDKALLVSALVQLHDVCSRGNVLAG